MQNSSITIKHKQQAATMHPPTNANQLSQSSEAKSKFREIEADRDSDDLQYQTTTLNVADSTQLQEHSSSACLIQKLSSLNTDNIQEDCVLPKQKIEEGLFLELTVPSRQEYSNSSEEKCHHNSEHTVGSATASPHCHNVALGLDSSHCSSGCQESLPEQHLSKDNVKRAQDMIDQKTSSTACNALAIQKSFGVRSLGSVTADCSAKSILKKPTINDYLEVSKSFVNFGEAMPGQVLEESIQVMNKSAKRILVQIDINCLNSELVGSEEYIYAIRRSRSQEYNDQHFISMSGYSHARFKLAVKTPGLKLSESIKGEVIFSIDKIADTASLTLKTTSLLPKLISPKQLFHNGLQCNVIKLAMKRSKKLDAKVPIKNLGDVPLVLEISMFTSKEREENDGYRSYSHPPTLVLAGDSTGFVTVMLKPPFSKQLASPKCTTIKRILVAKCKDASIMYSFVLLINFMD